MSEPYADQLSRVRLMAEGDSGTWDLSPNDVEALRAVLAEVERLRDNLHRSEEHVQGGNASFQDVLDTLAQLGIDGGLPGLAAEVAALRARVAALEGAVRRLGDLCGDAGVTAVTPAALPSKICWW